MSMTHLPSRPATRLSRACSPPSRRMRLILSGLCGLLLSATIAAAEPPANRLHYAPAPSADLQYAATAQHSGLSLKGSTSIRWAVAGERYDLRVVTNAAIVGKLLDSHSEGTIGAEGLQPVKLTEKRFRKPPHTVTFGRDDKAIRFSESATTYPLKGGEQDRTSITWQLVALARATPDRMKPGAEWKFFVAGRKDGETWTFRVVGRDTIRTAMGDISAVHLTKLSSPSREQQQLDLWLAPSLDWYPARIVFRDPKGTDLDQRLQRIDKRP